MERRGDFPPTGLEIENTPRRFTKGAGDIDMERLFRAIETLERRARKMSAAELHRLNQRLGEAVGRFNKAVMSYICRERPNQPRRFYAGEFVKIADTGARARIVRYLDSGHLVIEKDDGDRQIKTPAQLRKMAVDFRDSGLDPVSKS